MEFVYLLAKKKLPPRENLIEFFQQASQNFLYWFTLQGKTTDNQVTCIDPNYQTSSIQANASIEFNNAQQCLNSQPPLQNSGPIPITKYASQILLQNIKPTKQQTLKTFFSSYIPSNSFPQKKTPIEVTAAHRSMMCPATARPGRAQRYRVISV
jgi:hypothetical protein